MVVVVMVIRMMIRRSWLCLSRFSLGKREGGSRLVSHHLDCLATVKDLNASIDGDWAISIRKMNNEKKAISRNSQKIKGEPKCLPSHGLRHCLATVKDLIVSRSGDLQMLVDERRIQS